MKIDDLRRYHFDGTVRWSFSIPITPPKWCRGTVPPVMVSSGIAEAHIVPVSRREAGSDVVTFAKSHSSEDGVMHDLAVNIDDAKEAEELLHRRRDEIGFVDNLTAILRMCGQVFYGQTPGYGHGVETAYEKQQERVVQLVPSHSGVLGQ